MFYSHEILTNRQSGVSTIWLVATVGTGAQQRRLNRKTIQEVDLPKACETILAPGAPLALRLQANLLYGVSRVFSRQCGYVLSDAEKTQSDMMTFFRCMQTSELDPEAGKAKRHQITLEDDPSFDPTSILPNLDLLNSDKDLVFRQSQASTNGTSQMTPLGASSQGSSSVHRPSFMNFGIDLPESSPDAGSYRFPSDFGHRSSSLAKPAQDPEIMGEFRPFRDDEVEPFEGVNLDFDADGKLVGIFDYDEPELPLLPGQAPNLVHGAVMDREQEDQVISYGGEDVPFLLAEDELPDANAFAAQPGSKQPTALQAQVSETTETEKAAAKNKKTRRRKLETMLDENNRISRDEFRSWTENYVENMEAIRKRHKSTTQTQAKKNGLAFVYGSGIANVGILGGWMHHPLAEVFSGKALKAGLRGLLPEEIEDEPENGTEKRGRRRKASESFEEEEEDDQRRVKARVEDGVELGRGDQPDLGEQLMLGDDTAPEIGMDAVEAMDDRHSSSVMPWNRGGSAAPGSSVRGPGSAQKGPGPSPLHGHGSAIKSIERHSDVADAAFGSDDLGQLRSQDSSLDLGGPVGGLGFSQKHDTQASNAGLDMASHEFLTYAREHAEHKGWTRQGDLETRRWIEFDELASPETHNKAVAAQAFLHVLSLATKNNIVVEQDGEKSGVPFGTIRVGIDILEHSREGDLDGDMA